MLTEAKKSRGQLVLSYVRQPEYSPEGQSQFISGFLAACDQYNPFNFVVGNWAEPSRVFFLDVFHRRSVRLEQGVLYGFSNNLFLHSVSKRTQAALDAFEVLAAWPSGVTPGGPHRAQVDALRAPSRRRRGAQSVQPGAPLAPNRPPAQRQLPLPQNRRRRPRAALQRRPLVARVDRLGRAAQAVPLQRRLGPGVRLEAGPRESAVGSAPAC